MSKTEVKKNKGGGGDDYAIEKGSRKWKSTERERERERESRKGGLQSTRRL
jgi:hypothetical protein